MGFVECDYSPNTIGVGAASMPLGIDILTVKESVRSYIQSQ